MTTSSERVFGVSYLAAVDNAVRFASEAARLPHDTEDADPETIAALASLSSAWSNVAHLLYGFDADRRIHGTEEESGL